MAEKGLLEAVETLKDQESYQLWKCDVTRVLKSKGLFKIASGEACPVEEACENRWIQNDYLAQHVIAATVAKDVKV